MAADPLAVIRDLGIDDEEFESLAKRLYWSWRAKHPAPAPAPAPAPVLTEGTDESDRWWCFETRDDRWGWCETTRAACETTRAETLDTKSCERSRLFSPAECRDMAADRAHMTGCARQARVACFGKRHILADQQAVGCAPSIAGCKLRRAMVQKTYADDIKVTSECRAVD